VSLKEVLSLLSTKLSTTTITTTTTRPVVVGYTPVLLPLEKEPGPASAVTNDHLWRRMENFLKPGDYYYHHHHHYYHYYYYYYYNYHYYHYYHADRG